MFTCFKTNTTKRNEKCICGSGKKSKNCCNTLPTYAFIDKRKPENIPVDENKEKSENEQSINN
jgi:uncharacterized protein YecA (UPF0149 family)